MMVAQCVVGDNMPCMPRQYRKATKIAFKILGTPQNLAAKKSKEQKLINARLIMEETTRVR